MQAVSRHFRLISSFYIDIVYENIIILSINLIIYDWKPNKFEMGTNLVESAGPRGGLNEAYLSKFGMGTCFEGFELGLGGVGTWYDGLSHIDSAGLMLAESVEGLVDQARFWRTPMNKGEVAFLNFTALLHFTEEGGVILASCHQKKAGRFAVESADEGKEFIGILVAEPVDERESSIGTGGVNEPASRFIDDQERGVF